MRGVIRTEGKPMYVVSEATVNKILGNKHASPMASSPIDWSQCGLAKLYPDWDKYHELLWQERQDALAEGREPHPAAAEPCSQRNEVPAEVNQTPRKPPMSAAAVHGRSGGRKPKPKATRYLDE